MKTVKTDVYFNSIDFLCTNIDYNILIEQIKNICLIVINNIYKNEIKLFICFMDL